MTRAPAHAAICTAKLPTPPDAPWTRTVLPSRAPRDSRVRRAVPPARGRPPACSQFRLLGLAATARTGTDLLREGPGAQHVLAGIGDHLIADGELGGVEAEPDDDAGDVPARCDRELSRHES